MRERDKEKESILLSCGQLRIVSCNQGPCSQICGVGGARDSCLSLPVGGS